MLYFCYTYLTLFYTRTSTLASAREQMSPPSPPFVPRIAKDLGPFLLVTSEDTLSLVLETLSVVVEVDGSKWLTPELANSLVLAVIEVWAKNNKGEPYLHVSCPINALFSPLYLRSNFSFNFHGHLCGLGFFTCIECLRNCGQTSVTNSMHVDWLRQS